MKWLCTVVLLLATLVIGVVDLMAAPKRGTLDNLGDALLDEELARSLSVPVAEPSTPAEASDDSRPEWLPDEELLRRLMQREAAETAGEDAGASPMASVIEGMKQAGRLIETESIEQPAVPVQRRVVADLERLIAQMEKQCQGGKCNKPSESQKQASQRSQPKPGEGAKPAGAQPGPPQQAARSSTTSLGSAKSGAAVKPPAELMKAAWGHLPERVREQMLQASSDEFLPEYREQLEAYFRRLAEREAEQP